MYRLASSGLTTPPCGVPRLLPLPPVMRRVPSPSRSSTGALSHSLISCSTWRSTMRRATDQSGPDAESARNTSTGRHPPPRCARRALVGARQIAGVAKNVFATVGARPLPSPRGNGRRRGKRRRGRAPARPCWRAPDRRRGEECLRDSRALVRCLVREAMAAVVASEGVGGPQGWPAVVAPPLHERTPVRGRPGRLRDRRGQFVV